MHSIIKSMVKRVLAQLSGADGETPSPLDVRYVPWDTSGKPRHPDTALPPFYAHCLPLCGIFLYWYWSALVPFFGGEPPLGHVRDLAAIFVFNSPSHHCKGQVNPLLLQSWPQLGTAIHLVPKSSRILRLGCRKSSIPLNG